MNTIYQPRGKAAEYCELALNIYSGCSHGCTYCYMRPMHERFHDKGSFDTPVYRMGLITELQKELIHNPQKYKGATIHLCFSCDPYPAGIDTTPTREAIKLLKSHGCHVQILTKGGSRAERDFDLLDGGDWFGVTITSYDGGASDGVNSDTREPGAADSCERLGTLREAFKRGVKTWVSLEPVYEPQLVYDLIKYYSDINLFRIGKLNYHPSPINWGEFGRRCEELGRQYGRNVQIKDELRREMTCSNN